MLHDLRCGALVAGDDRRSACHGFDHHETEWFGPLDRVEECSGARKELKLVVVVEFAEIFDVGAKERLDRLLEVGDLLGFALLADDEQRNVGLTGEGGGAVGALCPASCARGIRDSRRRAQSGTGSGRCRGE